MITCVAIVAGCFASVASAAPPAVTTTADSATPGSGSLRAAVMAAAPGDTVVVPASTTPYTVTLGEIPITHAITIQGASATSTVIDAGGTSRVFHVTSAVPTVGTVTFKNVTIKRGSDTTAPGGGGILDESGALLLDRVTMTSNSVDITTSGLGAGGAAIYSTMGDVTVTNSNLSANTATIDDPGSGEQGGAAIHEAAGAAGTIMISGSTISGNHVTLTSPSCCNGGAVYQDAAKPITITASHLDNNVLTETGGSGCCSGGAALFQDANGPVSITSSTLNGNTANVADSNCCDGGGAVLVDGNVLTTLMDSTLNSNATTVTSAFCCSGGGAINTFGPVHASNVTLDSNRATVTDGNCCDGAGAVMVDGGGTQSQWVSVEMSHNVTSVHSTGALVDSCCNGGGGLIDHNAGGSFVMSASDISDNQANVDSTNQSGGAGVFAEDGNPDTLTNSTISGNSTNASGATDGGGGMYLDSPLQTDKLSFMTIAGNNAPGGAGGGVFASGMTVDLKASVVALNAALSAANCGGTGSPTFTSVGFNVEDTPGTCHFTATGDHVIAAGSIGLGVLADNGGPTMTRALRSGSAAINAVPSASCTDQASPTPQPVTKDQRGLARPQPAGGNCDAGAYEVGAADLSLSASAVPMALTVGRRATLTFRVANAGPAPATGTAVKLTLPAGLSFVSGTGGQGTCSGGASGPTCPVGLLLAGGSVRVMVTVTALAAGHQIASGTASANEPDRTATNNTSSVTLTVRAGTAPTLTHASQSHKIWREGAKLATLTRKHHKPPIGTTFSFTLNESATVRLAFNQKLNGRKVKHGRCVAQTNKNRKHSKCTRTIPRGTLSFSGHAGLNKVSFQGRISRANKLKPGHYTVLISARAGGKTSSPARLSFTIAPG